MKRTLLTALAAVSSLFVQAQCTVLPTATTGSVILQCASGTSNRCGVAFNPQFNLYYSVNAGSGGYPIETYASTGGSPVNSVASGFDYRGLWWNPNTSRLEGNGYGSNGVAYHTLNTSGYALGSVTNIFTGQYQPSSQSCNTYDYNANEILGYGNNYIYRYNSTTGTFLGAYPVTGLPVSYSSMDSTSLGYTGCLGMEIALYDNTNKAVYFINKANGAYVTSSTLTGAVGGDRFMFAFANNMAWVFNPNNMQWQSYVVFAPTAVQENAPAVSVNIFPNPSSGQVTVKGMEKGTMEFYNALGEKVYSVVIGNDLTSFGLQQPKGMYFWKAVRDEKMIASGKIVIE